MNQQPRKLWMNHNEIRGMIHFFKTPPNWPQEITFYLSRVRLLIGFSHLSDGIHMAMAELAQPGSELEQLTVNCNETVLCDLPALPQMTKSPNKQEEMAKIGCIATSFLPCYTVLICITWQMWEMWLVEVTGESLWTPQRRWSVMMLNFCIMTFWKILY